MHLKRDNAQIGPGRTNCLYPEIDRFRNRGGKKIDVEKQNLAFKDAVILGKRKDQDLSVKTANAHFMVLSVRFMVHL